MFKKLEKSRFQLLVLDTNKRPSLLPSTATNVMFVT